MISKDSKSLPLHLIPPLTSHIFRISGLLSLTTIIYFNNSPLSPSILPSPHPLNTTLPYNLLPQTQRDNYKLHTLKCGILYLLLLLTTLLTTIPRAKLTLRTKLSLRTVRYLTTLVCSTALVLGFSSPLSPRPNPGTGITIAICTVRVVLGLVLSVWIVESVTCEGEGWYWHVAEGGWELEGEERVEIAQGGVGGIMSRGGVFNISSICLYPVSFLSSEAAEEGVGEEGEEFTNVLYWGYYRTNFIEVYEKLCNKPLIEVEPLSVGPRIAMHAVLVFICGALLMLTNPTNPTTVTGLMGWLQGGCKEVFWRVFLAFATGDRYTKAVSGRARNQKTHPEARGLKTESGDTSVMEKSDLDTSVTNQENGMGQAFTREEKDDEKGGEMGETETQRKIVVETPKTTICYSLQLLLKFSGLGSTNKKYTPTENYFLTRLLECFSTPSAYWAFAGNVSSPTGALSMYKLMRVPTSMVTGAHMQAVRCTGIVNAPATHTASFIWDMNSEYRVNINKKTDIVRTYVPHPDDPGAEPGDVNRDRFASFMRKWLPPPLAPRDFYMYFAWKRLDERRIVIWSFNGAESEYNKIIFTNPALQNQTAVRSKCNQLVVFEELPPSSPGEQIKTKMHYFITMDFGGHIPGWVVSSRMAIVCGLISETQDYFTNAASQAAHDVDAKGLKHIRSKVEEMNSENALNSLANQSLGGGGSREYGVPNDHGSTFAVEDALTNFVDIDPAASKLPPKLTFPLYIKKVNDAMKFALPRKTENETAIFRNFPYITSLYQEKSVLMGSLLTLYKSSKFEEEQPEIQESFLIYNLLNFNEKTTLFAIKRGGHGRVISIVLIVIAAIAYFACRYALHLEFVTLETGPPCPVDATIDSLIFAGLHGGYILLATFMFSDNLPATIYQMYKRSMSQNQFDFVISVKKITVAYKQRNAVVIMIVILCSFSFEHAFDVFYPIWKKELSEEEFANKVFWVQMLNMVWFVFPHFIEWGISLRMLDIVPTNVGIFSVCMTLFSIWISGRSMDYRTLPKQPGFRYSVTTIDADADESFLKVVTFEMMLFSYLLYVFFFAISFLATKTFTSKMKFSTLWSSLNGKFTHARETHTRENETIFRANFSTLMKILQRLNDRLHVKLRKSIPNDEVEFMNYVGKGSSAQVYMARYRDSVVAVKELLDSKASLTEMLKFVAEMELMANLEHPNILKFEGIIVGYPKLCMVVEYCKPGNLRDIIEMTPFLDWKGKKTNFALSIADAMKFLHGSAIPILHRDLKTTNILLTEWWKVKLSDFGDSMPITQSTDIQNGAREEGMVGTELYMAPELFRGSKYSLECDVYSFGSVLADIAMSGNLKHLFVADEKFFEFKHFRIRLLDGCRPKLPQAWEHNIPVICDLINSCWSNDPSQRPTFSEIVKILEVWDGENEIDFDPHSKFVFRQKTPFSTFEENLISRGIEQLFGDSKRNVSHSNMFLQRMPRAEEPGTSTIRKVLKHKAWKICELAFDFSEPARQSRLQNLTNTKAVLLEQVNEHHQIYSYHWKKKVLGINMERKFIVNCVWQEISKGSFVIVVKSVPKNFVSLKDQQDGSFVHRGDTMVVLCIQDDVEGKTSLCNFHYQFRETLFNSIHCVGERENLTTFLDFLDNTLTEREKAMKNSEEKATRNDGKPGKPAALMLKGDLKEKLGSEKKIMKAVKSFGAFLL